MRAAEYRVPQQINGDHVRVVIAGDVVALPHCGWRYGGFGDSISMEWLLSQPNPPIPGEDWQREERARAIVLALGSEREVPGGPKGFPVFVLSIMWEEVLLFDALDKAVKQAQGLERTEHEWYLHQADLYSGKNAIAMDALLLSFEGPAKGVDVDEVAPGFVWCSE